ncbi:hypothetical protein [Burkholderia sp. Bp9012]|uniref:hypothetical protein n=1 Tax=Burkholderia sp. Bp9012 TaxID=2184562 RepID=UPI000F5ABEF7|nr:hypothetical protein [Burkholderia sp. Bp9012]
MKRISTSMDWRQYDAMTGHKVHREVCDLDARIDLVALLRVDASESDRWLFDASEHDRAFTQASCKPTRGEVNRLEAIAHATNQTAAGKGDGPR